MKEKTFTIFNVLCLLITIFAISCKSNAKSADAVTGATNIMSNSNETKYSSNSAVLIILYSSENSSTKKISDAIAGILEAEIKQPKQTEPQDLEKYELIGFGSGIFDQKHHNSLLELADKLPVYSGKKAFIFSTSGVARDSLLKENGKPKYKNKNFGDPHTQLRKILISKGFSIADEFNCAGFNNNGILKMFGGMNRNKPDENDIKQALYFAEKLKN